MKAQQIAPRFPKVESPFERHENGNGDYVVYDEWNVDPSWFKEETVAVEKLDGTNCAVYVEEGRVRDVFTRMGQRGMNYVYPYSSNTNYKRITRGVQNAVDRGYTDSLADGYHYGELIGPKISGNNHGVDEHLFIPFQWARENLRYESWGDYPQAFEALSQWFENDLFSLFHSKFHGTTFEEASVSNGAYCEGIMFTDADIPRVYWPEVRPQQDDYAKLRRDMFAWYEGERH